MIPKRVGIVVWLRNARDARHLERYGHLIYVSKRMKYAILYVNETELKAKMNQLARLPFVRKVEQSYLHEVAEEYNTRRTTEEEAEWPSEPAAPAAEAAEEPLDVLGEKNAENEVMEEKL